ncbi:MAG: DUF3524 domain-containing protein [Planctomycetes bacterium]|nr:DUF3524 domain-containing protein [Planctomycetota bacterium]
MKADRLRVAVLEPYYGGSHAQFVDTVVRNSRHEYVVATMPARKWKWRMRGAALWFSREDNAWLGRASGDGPDVILCNDMLSVADLRALLPRARRGIPIACYFHENQLTYPLPAEDERDYQYGMTNITSCLAADVVWFNSMFHLEDFLTAVGGLLAKMPDCVPPGIVEAIRQKSDVRPPPVDVASDDRRRQRGCAEPLAIVWPHRWEFDKNPEAFFDALLRLDEAGCDFRVVLLGEQFRTAPPVFESSWSRLKTHIVHAGFLPDRAAYLSILRGCDVVVSTAIQENFGIAVAEAILAGCQPLLPNRLVYPELVPEHLHADCLYSSDIDLFDRLRLLTEHSGVLERPCAKALQAHLREKCGVTRAVGRLDDGLSELLAGQTRSA